MKRIFLLLAILLTAPVCLRAQDAATEEQLNKLRGEITALQTSNVDLQKRLAEVLKELQETREQIAKPTGNYAAAEDVKRLADKIKEVDSKRQEDRELILEELKKIAKAASARPPVRPSEGAGGTRSSSPEKGYEYVIKSGDTLSGVLGEYRKQGIKISVEEVLKANPGLKPAGLKVGQTIFIPAPAQ